MRAIGGEQGRKGKTQLAYITWRLTAAASRMLGQH